MSDAPPPAVPLPTFVISGAWVDPDWEALKLEKPRSHPFDPKIAYSLTFHDGPTLTFPDALGALLYEMALDRSVTTQRLVALSLTLAASDRAALGLYLLRSQHRHDRVLAVGTLLEGHAADLRELATLLTTVEKIETRG